jgi:hypothetical protein
MSSVMSTNYLQYNSHDGLLGVQSQEQVGVSPVMIVSASVWQVVCGTSDSRSRQAPFVIEVVVVHQQLARLILKRFG